LRRKARTTEYLDKLSAVNTLQALDRADVAVLVLDASEGSVDQDARIAGHILERNRACVVALNKWDRVQTGERRAADVQGDIEHALRFLSLAEPVRISALKGTGLRHLFRAIRVAYRQFSRTVPTADLNRALQIITRHTPPPSRGKAPSRIFYGTQTGSRPPSFKVFTNHPDQIRAEYTRFMEHQLRYHFGFEGTPLKIEWSGREGKAAAADSKGDAGIAPPKRKAARPGTRHRPETSARRPPRGKPKSRPSGPGKSGGKPARPRPRQ
jgi:GTPase